MVVGNYDDPKAVRRADGAPVQRNRYRNIGTLMQTVHDDGRVGYWLKVNADAMNSTLVALAMRAGRMKKGDDTILIDVFERREKPAATQQVPADHQDDDDGEHGPF